MKFSFMRWLAIALSCAVLAACSTVQTPSRGDPFEGFNRSIETFNYDVDRAVFKPVAKGYQAVIPAPVRGCVSNFFGNIGDIFIGVNNILQGKIKNGVSDLCRFGVNTTVGIVGLFDVASELGLPKHNEDFGQTFGRWGAGPGPYLVLPFFGPSSIRDGVGLVFDTTTNPLQYVVEPSGVRYGLWGLRVIDKRAELLKASDTVDQFALDRYSFIRDAYLARRRTLVYDGNPPQEAISPEDESGYDDKMDQHLLGPDKQPSQKTEK
ncbi:MAG: VacJ family lipoprotein [Burkholderiaceae bacterium]|jgi:phospholipid-binding lipoprotein MlaA